jgi:abortive infection bacteriophage resistance protein
VQKAGFLLLPRFVMPQAVFSKQASTPEQLLQKLQSQGLRVTVEQQPLALAYLRYVGGYRLKGYWFHAINPLTKQFPASYKAKSIKFGNQKSFFSAAKVIQYLLSQTGLPHAWRDDLEALFKKYPLVDMADVGFPTDWKTRAGWQ